MEETGLENMTENTEKEKVLSKEAIVAALNERHSPEKQKLLSAGRVAIAGLGGLGSNVAYALARIGVGHLHLIDFDVVDITNLNRQQYFMEHLGMYKTDALKSLLLKIIVKDQSISGYRYRLRKSHRRKSYEIIL